MAILREPLLHFLVAGAAIFGAYAWFGRGAETAPTARVVRISESDVAWLKEAWVRQGRPEPSSAELRGLVADHLRETLLAREARELGLDEDDVIVRRRLAQKMRFLVEDTARAAEPAEADLRRLYDADPARFQAPARISFEQIFFSRERRGTRAAADAAEALAALARPAGAADPAALGDRSLLPPELDDVDEAAIAAQFGPELARAVVALEPGGWRGPVASTFGLHLVRVSAARKAEPRSFAEARPRLVEEWRREQERAADEAYFARLLEKYDIVADESVRPLLAPLGARAGSAP